MPKGFRRIILIILFLVFIGLAAVYLVKAAGDLYSVSALMYEGYGIIGAAGAIIVFILVLAAGGYLVWTSRHRDSSDTAFKRRKKK